MREIKFRGKSILPITELNDLGIKHDNGWVYGCYVDGFIVNGVIDATNEYIQIGNWCPVRRDTVGEYTGLKDKNGIEIYEGDIVNCAEYECYGEIGWNESDASFYFYVVMDGGGFEEERLYDYCDELEVIGNVYENPELLEVS